MFRRLADALWRLWWRKPFSVSAPDMNGRRGAPAPGYLWAQGARTESPLPSKHGSTHKTPPMKAEHGSSRKTPPSKAKKHGSSREGARAGRRKAKRPVSLTRYFDLHDDYRVPGRWELGDPVGPDGREVGDVWRFTAGRPVPPTGLLHLPVDPLARPLEFSLAGAGLTPVVHPRVAAIFAELAPEDVQLLPAEVEGQRERYFIVVATRLIRCIDDAACTEARYYTPEDGLPERVGQYRTVRGLRIDPSQVGGAQVFRPWGYPVTLVVSDALKKALEREGVTGARFTAVTETRH